ncbi:hypothetical protein LWI29_006579 [Acer saccharum]|uniref:Uncharacterized protein n=1 Tax=Acer saccharum TaxID=4024 RepID=A0AA39S3Y9_ACESA|nr:hypothetical protein LWI29_006579 [Acer saccharum]
MKFDNNADVKDFLLTCGQQLQVSEKVLLGVVLWRNWFLRNQLVHGKDMVLGLKKKLEVQSQFSTHKPKSDDAVRQFQDESQRLKAQKVQLQCKLKLEFVQFRVSEFSLPKEILQVLHRKTKETFMATERLKALLEPQKALACRKAGLEQST